MRVVQAGDGLASDDIIGHVQQNISVSQPAFTSSTHGETPPIEEDQQSFAVTSAIHRIRSLRLPNHGGGE